MMDALEKQVLDTLKPYLTIEGSSPRWLIGLSGGADSVFLLRILVNLRQMHPITLRAIHVNHGLRGAASDEDEFFCNMLCREWSVPLEVHREDIMAQMQSSGCGMEEAARNARFRIFQSESIAYGATAVLLAHHKDDQAETVLMHLLRGTGLSGLTGMKESTAFRIEQNHIISEDHTIQPMLLVRPLLGLRKSEMQAWLEYRHISWREDESNKDVDIGRNRVRLKVLPLLSEAMAVDPVEALARCAALVNDDNECLQILAADAFQKRRQNKSGRMQLDTSAWENLHISIWRRVLRLFWESETGSTVGLEAQHIERMIGCIKDMKSRKQGKPSRKVCSLPDKRIAISTANVIWFSKDVIMSGEDRNSACFELQLTGPGHYSVEGPARTTLGKLTITRYHRQSIQQKWFEAHESDFTQYFDGSLFTSGLRNPDVGMDTLFRFRRTGDTLYPKGAPGSKKLKDWFIDSKVPVDERDQIPIVAMGKDIVWVIGYRTSEKYRITADSHEVWSFEWQKIDALEE